MRSCCLLQLTEGASCCSSEDRARCDDGERQRAIRLLQDSLTDAKVALTRSLTMSLDANLSKESVASEITWSRSMESVLERYSERLSSRALEVFKEKLDEQMPPATVTKL